MIFLHIGSPLMNWPLTVDWFYIGVSKIELMNVSSTYILDVVKSHDGIDVDDDEISFYLFHMP